MELPHQRLKEELKGIIIDSVGEVFQKLRTIFQEDSNRLNTVIGLFSEFKTLQNKEIAGISSVDQINLEQRQIISRTLLLIDTIDEKDAISYELKTTNFDKILIVCRVEERRKYMKDIFPNRYYGRVEIKIENDLPDEIKLNTYDLIVFDNFPCENSPIITKHLKTLLNLSNPLTLILYFGKYLPELSTDAYAEKVYFTNSIFSLPSRVNEMLTYLKYQKAKIQKQNNDNY